MKSIKFNKTEKNLVYTISFTLGLRLMAMMLVMPLMAVYARSLKGSTPFLAGLAIGTFGLTQAIFQIPFGKWSDRYGRKPMVLVGMLLLVVGLIIAGFARNIYVLILGRAIQGCGGINAVAFAWIGDGIIKEKRDYAMGVAGALGGIASILGFIIGPIFYKVVSVSTMFYICAVIVFIACGYIYLSLKEEPKNRDDKKHVDTSIRNSFSNFNIAKLDVSVFLMSYTMTALFFILPILFEDSKWTDNLWKVLTLATLVGIASMKLMIKGAYKKSFNLMGMISFLFIAICGILLFNTNNYVRSFGMIIFMCGYLYLTTTLPSNVTKMAPKEILGQVTGIFNMMQFMGSFVGGAVTGLLWKIGEKYAIGVIVLIGICGIIIVKTIKIKRSIV